MDVRGMATTKIGPLPAIAWGGIIGAAILAKRWFFPSATSETAATPNANPVDTSSDSSQFPASDGAYTWDATSDAPFPTYVVNMADLRAQLGMVPTGDGTAFPSPGYHASPISSHAGPPIATKANQRVVGGQLMEYSNGVWGPVDFFGANPSGTGRPALTLPGS